MDLTFVQVFQHQRFPLKFFRGNFLHEFALVYLGPDARKVVSSPVLSRRLSYLSSLGKYSSSSSGVTTHIIIKRHFYLLISTRTVSTFLFHSVNSSTVLGYICSCIAFLLLLFDTRSRIRPFCCVCQTVSAIRHFLCVTCCWWEDPTFFLLQRKPAGGALDGSIACVRVWQCYCCDWFHVFSH